MIKTLSHVAEYTAQGESMQIAFVFPFINASKIKGVGKEILYLFQS